ncbi:hypothetical protein BGZ60DRAFT_404034 [Tricladium varicosporioides]|nr:hypothetical protein BGZ60DRAFT_404034 [Hymenoscyphus varicosporioides]
MGNSLSVSSIVDQLHMLQPAARSQAFDNLCEQHDEIREYLESKCYWNSRPTQQQQLGQTKLRQQHLHTIQIKKTVPEEERLTEKDISLWNKDPSFFWTYSSFSFLPPEDCHNPLNFVLDVTSWIERQGHKDCLRGRYLALFWFDCFNTRFPEQEKAFDQEYVDLGRCILGPTIVERDERVSMLREQVKAGRKYNMLTRKFGDAILLTLPSCIGRSTLERKLPLEQGKFDSWISPVVGSTWEEQSKREDVHGLGRRIRQIILQRCHASSLVQPSKKRKTNSTVITVQETASTVTVRSVVSPISPSASPSASIPPLFYAMGSHIPEIVLDRALSPQARWNESGEFDEITIQDAGLHEDLVDLLSDRTKFKRNVEGLVSQSMIHKEISRGGFQTYTCQCELARISYEQNRAYWIHQAFDLCCYIFPRSQILEPSFEFVGRQLLHVLKHLLRLYENTHLKIPLRRDAVEALVSASKFGGMSDRKYFLKIATDLQKDLQQTDIQAMVVHRESVLLRLNKEISNSRRVIEQFLDRPLTEVNPRLHSLLGLLHLSQAENWAYHFNHEKVYEEAQKWGPGDNPSPMQLYVLRTKLKVLGQSYKGGGHFEDAKPAFEGCLAAMKPDDSERFLIKCHLADVYCEMDYLKRKQHAAPNIVYLEEAEKIVRPEIEHLQTRGRDLRHLRRLRLSLVEIEIIRGRQSAAECLIKELLANYNRLTEHDINDQVGHVRALIAWARISEPSTAVARWHTALSWNKIYHPSEGDVFTCGVIYLFMSLAYFKIGDTDESWASFNRAVEIIRKKEPQFLIPGVGTYLYDFAWREIWSVAGWVLPGKAL